MSRKPNASTLSATKSTKASTTKKTVKGSQHGLSSVPEFNTIIVYDEDGNDVTPLPLMAPSTTAAHPKKLGKQMDMMSSVAFGGGASIANASQSESVANASFLKSEIKTDNNASMMGSINGSMNASVTEGDAEDADGLRKYPTGFYLATKIKPAPPLDVNEPISVTLNETETIWILDMPSLSVTVDIPDEYSTVKAQNARYAKIIADKVYKQTDVTQSTQTERVLSKVKEVQTHEPQKADIDCLANAWLIFDAVSKPLLDETLRKEEHTEDMSKESLEADAEDLLMQAAAGNESKNSSMASSLQMSSASQMQTASLMNSQSQSISTSQVIKSNDSQLMLKNRNVNDDRAFKKLDQCRFGKSLSLMERAIMSNIYEKNQFKYRKINIGELMMLEEAEGTASISTLRLLWGFWCEKTKGRTVTCLSWNKENRDIVVVGYSKFNDKIEESGLILCWSCKNPEWPERIYNTKSSVVSLDFSKLNANLLAVGMRNGSISLFDVRLNQDHPVMDNSSIIGKHRDAVSELRWVPEDIESKSAEVLVSVSSDGRVIQWSIRKGWEHKDIMTIKILKDQERHKESGGDKKQNSLLNRVVGGLSIDFSPKDTNNYLISTDDGHIHGCSRSYNEQYLTTYYGHNAPVYKTRWSMLNPSFFLTCCGDWTVKLWQENQSEKPLMNFHCEKAGIVDIAWCPLSSTVFGSINTNGNLEIWDLTYSTLDPCIRHGNSDKKMTHLLFSHDAPVVLVGDLSGVVGVYLIDNLPSIQTGLGIDEQSQILQSIVNEQKASLI